MTPKEWKKGGYINFSNNILKSSVRGSKSTANFSELIPKIIKINSFKIYYIRHKGYNQSIKNIWQKLQTWSLCNNIKSSKQIGVHHDNPTITPLVDCKYIGGIAFDEEINNSSLPYLQIPEEIYAKFEFSGKYGDIIAFMNWIYFDWIINNEYETTTNPSFVIYNKNHFLEEDETFNVQYHIPIKY